MSAVSDYQVWATYNSKRKNISKSAEDIVEYLNSKNSVSSKTGADAKLLTRFFRDLKKYSKQRNAGENPKLELMGEEISENIGNILNKINIDFNIGGQSSAGIAFEKELEKLFDYSAVDDQVLQGMGQQSGGVYLHIGKDFKNTDEAISALAKMLGQKINTVQKNYFDKIIVGDQWNNKDPRDYYVRIGVRRAGKTDLYGSSQTVLDIHGEFSEGSNISKALDLLKNSTISIKSYKSASSSIHLGKTAKTKAVSAVAEYVAGQPNHQNAKWAGYFYLRHPNEESAIKRLKSVPKQEQLDEIKFLYERYDYMRNVFELTGLGLSFADLQTMRSVDFLLVNRYGDEDISVYATQDLLSVLKRNKYSNSITLSAIQVDE